MLRSMSLVLAVALAFPGCAYIGQAKFEEKRASLDQDKDGAPFDGPGKDCDDSDDRVSPNNPEIPYDGLDNDCQGGDIVDADGDGFPGVDKAQYLADHPNAKWPAGVQDGPVDCADDETIWPDAKNIYPGNSNDPVYDGIDSDCAGDNDFDGDGDGYVPDEFQDAFEQYVLDWGYTHLSDAVKFGDCNDFRAAANPDTDPADDAWYDGHDDDCAGNNDFDADGDGYMWDEDANAARYVDFIDTYHPGGAPWPEQWGDCLDQPDPTLTVSADPFDVHPGAPDTPYDGIDSDCLCDNDFDGDGDGVMPDSAAASFPDYLADWGCPLDEVYGDCADDDPLTAPGALERLDAAGADSDCDGDPDSTPFGFGDSLWSNARAPRVLRGNDHYIIATSADWADLDGQYTLGTATAATSVKQDSGVLLAFDFTAGYDARPAVAPTTWFGANNQLKLGERIDAVAGPDSLWLVTSYYFPGSSGYLTIKNAFFNATQGTYALGETEWDLVSTDYVATGTNVGLDSAGYPWAVSCAPSVAQALHADGDALVTVEGGALGPSPLNPAGIPSGVCFLAEEPPATGPARIVVCDPGVDCETYDYDPGTASLTVSATNDWAGRALDDARYRDGWFLLQETGSPGIRIEGPEGNFDLLANWTVHSFDVAWRDVSGGGSPDTLYVGAVVEPIPDDGAGRQAGPARLRPHRQRPDREGHAVHPPDPDRTGPGQDRDPRRRRPPDPRGGRGGPGARHHLLRHGHHQPHPHGLLRARRRWLGIPRLVGCGPSAHFAPGGLRAHRGPRVQRHGPRTGR